jgi:hypothetical protein
VGIAFRQGFGRARIVRSYFEDEREAETALKYIRWLRYTDIQDTSAWTIWSNFLVDFFAPFAKFVGQQAATLPL